MLHSQLRMLLLSNQVPYLQSKGLEFEEAYRCGQMTRSSCIHKQHCPSAEAGVFQLMSGHILTYANLGSCDHLFTFLLLLEVQR